MSLLMQRLPEFIRNNADQLNWQLRRTTWRQRSLPDFIIIGAQKAGTSSLFEYLAQHPQLEQSYTKEVHYFDGGILPEVDRYADGESWYRAHFPMKAALGKESQVFEASPMYLFNPLVAERMHALLPAVKIIAVLRNPTERAISHYFHVANRGKEPLSIAAALQAEEQRLRPALLEQDYKNPAFRLYSYQSRGKYHEQLVRYQQFFPAEQTLILSSEMFFRQPQLTLRRVFEFLGVDQKFIVPDLKPRNVASQRTTVDSAVYQQLNEFFRHHNEALFQMSGENFGWND